MSKLHVRPRFPWAIASLLVLAIGASPSLLAESRLRCDASAPARLCARVRAQTQESGTTWTLAPVASSKAKTPPVIASWVLAVTSPFQHLRDDIALDDVRRLWRGEVLGEGRNARGLAVSEEALPVLAKLLDAPPAPTVVVISGVLDPSNELWARYWLTSFDEALPKRKMIKVNATSLLDKSSDVDALKDYPLKLGYTLEGKGAANDRPGRDLGWPVTNRDVAKMTVLAMTGVTAITRGMADLVSRKGAAYPARDIGSWFRDADFVHVSNEVSFKPDCPVTRGTMSFCSDESYIAVLESIGVNVVELTGNHIVDKDLLEKRALKRTRPWFSNSLRMYRDRGWKWFGGGMDLADALRPLELVQGPNRIVLLGCNQAGPDAAFATAERPGGAPCDWDRLAQEVVDYRARGWSPIVSIQHWEVDSIKPSTRHIHDFGKLSKARPVAIQGSQAHRPKPMQWKNDTFIAYGLGNLFFDQMYKLSVREMMVHRYVFYDGRLLSIEVLTGMNEEFGKPRPMTEKERRRFLNKLNAVGL